MRHAVSGLLTIISRHACWIVSRCLEDRWENLPDCWTGLMLKDRQIEAKAEPREAGFRGSLTLKIGGEEVFE